MPIFAIYSEGRNLTAIVANDKKIWKVTIPKMGMIKSNAYNVKCTARASLALAMLKSAAGGGGGDLSLPRNRSTTRIHSDNPNKACTLIQKAWLCLGHESCSSPKVPTTTRSTNKAQCAVIAQAP